MYGLSAEEFPAVDDEQAFRVVTDTLPEGVVCGGGSGGLNVNDGVGDGGGDAGDVERVGERGAGKLRHGRLRLVGREGGVRIRDVHRAFVRRLRIARSVVVAAEGVGF